jgi:hypothetical protein
VAEIIAGELARGLGLPVPEQVLVQLDAGLARSEPDAEVRELLQRSVGTNLALGFLSGATMFDPVAGPAPAPELASAIVVFDAFVSNVDRTPRNPNLLVWRDGLWLIDHGAALYWQHAWDGTAVGSDRPFAPIKDHVLLPWAGALETAGQSLAARTTDAELARVCSLVPDAWLTGPGWPVADVRRAALAAYLSHRRDASAAFVGEATRARSAYV